MMYPAPVVVVGNDPPSVRSEAFHVVRFFAPEAVIRCKGSMGVDAHVAVIDPGIAPIGQAVAAALFLRNAGMTVLITDPRRAPADLVGSLHGYMAQMRALTRPVQTEVLVLEDAMHLSDDIDEAVRAFERGTA
jgi:hypothetical protein